MLLNYRMMSIAPDERRGGCLPPFPGGASRKLANGSFWTAEVLTRIVLRHCVDIKQSKDTKTAMDEISKLFKALSSQKLLRSTSAFWAVSESAAASRPRALRNLTVLTKLLHQISPILTPYTKIIIPHWRMLIMKRKRGK